MQTFDYQFNTSPARWHSQIPKPASLGIQGTEQNYFPKQ